MSSEINELKYERLLEERSLRNDIEKIDSYVSKVIAAIRNKYKKRKNAKLSRLSEVKAEIDGNAPQPQLFDSDGNASPEARGMGKETENRRNGESATYPEKEEKIIVPGMDGQSSEKKEKCTVAYRDDKGKTYYAGKGLGEGAYMTFKGFPTDSINSRHRYVNRSLPVVTTLETAESDLATYAKIKGWKKVEENFESLALSSQSLGKIEKCIICAKDVENLQASGICPDCDEQRSADDINQKSKKRLKQGDTMKVERTLTRVATFGTSCETLENEKINEFGGCCICEKEKCDLRLIKFGEASKCHMGEACSQECPRLVKKEDAKDKGDREGQDSKESFTESALPGAIYKPDIANARKVLPDFLPIKIDQQNEKIILIFSPLQNGFVEFKSFKTKAAAASIFREYLGKEIMYEECQVTLINTSYTTWPHSVYPKLAGLTCFRGDYDPEKFGAGCAKKIRFMNKSHSWGKAEKFTNEIQYFARLEELRKDPNYIEA